MANTRAPSQRLYDLDALRAVAMMLGILLHTSLFVLPEQVFLWPIYDPAAAGDPFYRYVIDSIHGFRMPIFFVLSGFFSALLWQRRGLRSLGKQRLMRVGIPFIASCFTVIPISVWLLAAISGGAEPYDFPLWVLPLIWLFGTLGHLWFLWYLMLMSAGFIIVARLGIQFRNSVACWLLIPLSALISLTMVEPVFGADTAVSIIPELPVIGYYLCFFIFGVFFYQRDFTVHRWWTALLLPAAAAFYIASGVLYRYASSFEEAASNEFLFKNESTLFAAPFEAAFAWLMVFGLMGLFRWFLARESYTSRYLSDASYWMYISHLPLVVIGQFLVIGLPIHYHLKFLIVCVGVTAAVLVIYQLGVRYTFIGKALNGPRTRRPQPPAPSPTNGFQPQKT